MEDERFNDEIAEQAIELALPFIQNLMDTGIAKRQDLNIVVGNLDGVALATKSLGDVAKWENAYKTR